MDGTLGKKKTYFHEWKTQIPPDITPDSPLKFNLIHLLIMSPQPGHYSDNHTRPGHTHPTSITLLQDPCRNCHMYMENQAAKTRKSPSLEHHAIEG